MRRHLQSRRPCSGGVLSHQTCSQEIGRGFWRTRTASVSQSYHRLRLVSRKYASTHVDTCMRSSPRSSHLDTPRPLCHTGGMVEAGVFLVCLALVLLATYLVAVLLMEEPGCLIVLLLVGGVLLVAAGSCRG